MVLIGVLVRVRHWLAHWLGWNEGNVVVWAAGARLMVGFRCWGCGKLSGVHDELRAENERLRAWAEAEQAERYRAEDQRTDERSEVERLRALLRRILTDPEARILDSDRDDAWETLGRDKCR